MRRSALAAAPMAAIAAVFSLGAAPTWAEISPGAVATIDHGSLAGDAAQAARVVDAFHTALKKGDGKAASDLLAETALIFEAGGAERSKADYQAKHLADDLAYESKAVERIVRRSGAAIGDTAWIATQGQVQSGPPGHVTRRLTTETMVLQRYKTEWRIVHIHWSSRAAPLASAQ